MSRDITSPTSHGAAETSDSPVVNGIRMGSLKAERVLSGDYQSALQRINHYFSSDEDRKQGKLASVIEEKVSSAEGKGSSPSVLKPVLRHALSREVSSSVLLEPETRIFGKSSAPIDTQPVILPPEAIKTPVKAALDASLKDEATPPAKLKPRPPTTAPPKRNTTTEITPLTDTTTAATSIITSDMGIVSDGHEGGCEKMANPSTPPNNAQKAANFDGKTTHYDAKNTHIAHTAAATAAVSAPSGSLTASQAMAAPDFDIRAYVPRSGSTGLRFSEALKIARTSLTNEMSASMAANMTGIAEEAEGGEGQGTPGRLPPSTPVKPAPQAPIGVPKAAQTPLANLTPAQVKDRQNRIRLENTRCLKWKEMLDDWDGWLANPSKYERLKKRCRKGIPEPVRSMAWFKISKADKAKAADPGLYDRLLSMPIAAPVRKEGSLGSIDSSEAVAVSKVGKGAEGRFSEGGATTDIIDTIERDINRTFPHYSMFSEVGGVGQTALFRILVAYAQYDQRVGYCQGMGFLAAMFLSYMPEEDAFYLFLQVLKEEPWKLCDLYAPGLPRVGLLEHTLQGLLNTRLPKLAARFHSFHLHPTMFAAQWILTIYTYNFPFNVVVRVWDSFLFEGWKIVFRVALAALKICEADFLKCVSFEEIMMQFRELPGRLDPDALSDAAFGLSLSGKEIDALQAEYAQLVELGHPTSGELAGRGVAAHVKEAATKKRGR